MEVERARKEGRKWIEWRGRWMCWDGDDVEGAMDDG